MPYRVDCWNCGGEGVIEDDCTCGEDTCCCLDLDPRLCTECHGSGYLIVSQLTDDNCDSAIAIGD